MTEIEASRTLVKSPPELWAECSEASTLARHLGQFGEIKITRLEPESAVAWEGTLASGTVRLEPSGWGTKVILTATQVEASPEPATPEATVEPEAVEPGPDAVVPAEPAAPPPEPTLPEPVAIRPEPVAPRVPAPVTQRQGGLFGRLFGRFLAPQPPVIAFEPLPPQAPRAPKPDPAPVAVAPAPQPDPVAVAPAQQPDPVAVPPAPKPDPVAVAPAPVVMPEVDPEAILAAALDSLGQAHHRPFSRG